MSTTGQFGPNSRHLNDLIKQILAMSSFKLANSLLKVTNSRLMLEERTWAIAT